MRMHTYREKMLCNAVWPAKIVDMQRPNCISKLQAAVQSCFVPLVVPVHGTVSTTDAVICILCVNFAWLGIVWWKEMFFIVFSFLHQRRCCKYDRRGGAGKNVHTEQCTSNLHWTVRAKPHTETICTEALVVVLSILMISRWENLVRR